MRTSIIAIALVAASVAVATPSWSRTAQAAPADLEGRVLAVVRAAVEPALPYPPSDDAGAMPADGISTAPWMVRPIAAGDQAIEILANPLNAENQARSNKAMAQIERAVEAAQRKSQAQYERAVADAQRTGKSQNVDGITLADEGVAGARIDAESHVVIDVEMNKPGYLYRVASAQAPVVMPAVTGPMLVWSVPANVYRERQETDEHYSPARAFLLFGRFGQTGIKRSGTTYDLTAAGAPGGPAGGTGVRSLVVRLSGNEELIAEIARKSDWNRVRTLLEQ